MSAAACAQPGVHHADCQCTVTGVPTIGVPHLPVMRDATAGPMHPPCGDPACPGPHAIPEAPEPVVVCASCGRSKDMPARLPGDPGRDLCEDPDWHRPQPEVPDVDVTAEDGDDLAPLTEDDLLQAVGPEPGRTWAELYAQAALQLSYRTAELNGARRELERLRALPVAPINHGMGEATHAVVALVWAHGEQQDDGSRRLVAPVPEWLGLEYPTVTSWLNDGHRTVTVSVQR